MRDIFKQTCEKYSGWAALTADTQSAYIRRMERCCYNDAVITCDSEGIYRSFQYVNGAFCSRYQTNCYKVLANLDVEGPVESTYLIEKICAGIIDVENILLLTSYDMCPDASRVIHDEINLRKQQKVEQKISKQYKCSKCSKSETVYQEIMARSADEPMVLCITCVNCGHRWRRG